MVPPDDADRLHEWATRESLLKDEPPGWNVPVLTTLETLAIEGLALMASDENALWHVVLAGDELLGVVPPTELIRLLIDAEATRAFRA